MGVCTSSKKDETEYKELTLNQVKQLQIPSFQLKNLGKHKDTYEKITGTIFFTCNFKTDASGFIHTESISSCTRQLTLLSIFRATHSAIGNPNALTKIRIEKKYYDILCDLVNFNHKVCHCRIVSNKYDIMKN